MGQHVVLVHGAWHGGGCRDGIIQELEKAGYTAEAPTMPGHHQNDDRSGIQLSNYVEKIVEVVNQHTEPVVLVGHSSAGFLLQMAAPKVMDKVAKLIFLNAFILPEGQSQFDLVPPDVAEGMIGAAKASPDMCVPILEDFVRNVLMSGEPQELQDTLLQKLVPQPLALFTTPISRQDFDQLTIPKAVVFCKGDISLPPGAYQGMAQSLGEHTFIEVEGSHEALFTNPAAVAAGLLQALK